MKLNRLWKLVVQDGECLAEAPPVLKSWAEVKAALAQIEAGLGWEGGHWKKVNDACAVKRWPGMPGRLVLVWVYLAPVPVAPKPAKKKAQAAQPQVN